MLKQKNVLAPTAAPPPSILAPTDAFGSPGVNLGAILMVPPYGAAPPPPLFRRFFSSFFRVSGGRVFEVSKNEKSEILKI